MLKQNNSLPSALNLTLCMLVNELWPPRSDLIEVHEILPMEREKPMCGHEKRIKPDFNGFGLKLDLDPLTTFEPFRYSIPFPKKH